MISKTTKKETKAVYSHLRKIEKIIKNSEVSSYHEFDLEISPANQYHRHIYCILIWIGSFDISAKFNVDKNSAYIKIEFQQNEYYYKYFEKYEEMDEKFAYLFIEFCKKAKELLEFKNADISIYKRKNNLTKILKEIK